MPTDKHLNSEDDYVDCFFVKGEMIVRTKDVTQLEWSLRCRRLVWRLVHPHLGVRDASRRIGLNAEQHATDVMLCRGCDDEVIVAVLGHDDAELRQAIKSRRKQLQIFVPKPLMTVQECRDALKRRLEHDWSSQMIKVPAGARRHPMKRRSATKYIAPITDIVDNYEKPRALPLRQPQKRQCV